MTDDAFESRILAFEEAWRRQGPSDIAKFLDEPAAATAEAQRRLLVELVAVDLEYRWRSAKSPGPALLETYAARFPDLGPLEQLPLELIGEEYRVRRLWGDRPSHVEYLGRFAARGEKVGNALLRIDAELDDEASDPRCCPRPAAELRAAAVAVPDALGLPCIPIRDILLQRMIGAGRTGKVYRAYQRSAARDVAVKFLRKSYLEEGRVVRRFIGEAKTIALLRHPNIVGTHGLGRTNAGAYFIAMDLVNGPNLAQVSELRRIAVQEAVTWAIQTCHALQHAHFRGIIHCDLKPANILLGDDGVVRVTDFGLARSLTEHSAWTADVEGTAPFMAPEQVSDWWGTIDERTDVYGVGAVLYSLLTGRPPWVSRRLPDILAQVVSAAPVTAPAEHRPELTSGVDNLCQKCLSKAPAERYTTVGDLRSALVRLGDVTC